MEIQSIDDAELNVTPAIMDKVREIHRQRQGEDKPRRKKQLLSVALTAILVLSSLTVYANNQYLQIKNKEGIIILSTIPAIQYTDSDYKQKRREEAQSELSKRLKPGELAAYYIEDTRYSKEPQIEYYFHAMERKHYDDLAKDMVEMKAPVVLNPSYLPEGYVFDYGVVQRGLPTEYKFANKPEYQSLMHELQASSEKTDEVQGLYYKIMNTTKADSTVMYFRNGEKTFNLVVFSDTKSPQIRSDQAIRVTVKGKEMILSAVSSSKRSLSWRSDDERDLYMINDIMHSALSNEEFIQIAESMIIE
ncbi:hypothetical protein JCM10914_5226 [Paenibacillus sp. JCM 10914]|nr:hypothetical protein JCM10914_5226 [Paenibacillus sp. JCM 10914]